MSYAARTTSTFLGQPFEGYWFSCGTSHWRYASGDVPRVILGQTYTPAALSRDEIDQCQELRAGQTKVRLPLDNPVAQAQRFGEFGEIMPENEFLGLLDICDVFDLVWLEKGFAAAVRPALESLCAGLGCELPLPRHAADIAIESSDIQPDASREAYFTLHATLRNRAAFQQAWPHVEITLTDARDKALVRRVLAPAQWLPADAPKEAFPTKGEVAIRVAFEAPGVAAAGYRVYAFYP